MLKPQLKLVTNAYSTRCVYRAIYTRELVFTTRSFCVHLINTQPTPLIPIKRIIRTQPTKPTLYLHCKKISLV